MAEKTTTQSKQPIDRRALIKAIVLCFFIVAICFAAGIFLLNFVNNSVQFYLQEPQLQFDEETKSVIWQPIYRAANYQIFVDGVDLGKVQQGNCALSTLDLPAGEYSVVVRANGMQNVITSPLSKEYKFRVDKDGNIDKPTIPTKLHTPKNLKIFDGVLYWDSVENAKQYAIRINESIFYSQTNSLNILNLKPLIYQIAVKAMAE